MPARTTTCLRSLVPHVAVLAMILGPGCGDDSSEPTPVLTGDDPIAEACEVLEGGSPRVLAAAAQPEDAERVEDGVGQHLQAPLVEDDSGLGLARDRAEVLLQIPESGEFQVVASTRPTVEKDDGTVPMPWDYRHEGLPEHQPLPCDVAAFSARYEFDAGVYRFSFDALASETVDVVDLVVLPLEDRHTPILSASPRLSPTFVAPRVVQFPEVRELGDSQEREVVVANIGGANLEITDIELAGDGVEIGRFELTESPDLPLTLEPRDDFTISIRYTGELNAGGENARVNFGWRAGGEENTSSLEISGNPFIHGILTSKDQLTFFQVPEGDDVFPQIASVTNIGTLPLTIEGVTIEGSMEFSVSYPDSTDPASDPADDQTSLAFPIEILPEEVFPIRVTFSPTDMEIEEAELKIDGTMPVTIQLRGNEPL